MPHPGCNFKLLMVMVLQSNTEMSFTTNKTSCRHEDWDLGAEMICEESNDDDFDLNG